MYKLVIKEAYSEDYMPQVGHSVCLDTTYIGTVNIIPVSLQNYYVEIGKLSSISRNGFSIFTSEAEAMKYASIINESFDLIDELNYYPNFYNFEFADKKHSEYLIEELNVPVEDFITINTKYKVKVVPVTVKKEAGFLKRILQSIFRKR